ncbi:MAG: response regulator [Gemmatimonas sp.]|jgi:DNA-binding NarL/FixJ family response regulator|uniref:response regulator n=1 Tax=Gemmatimonas sp. TaxID=1962908 RepID=UPI0022CD18D0|nr:response regulator transcription factor [Gemmatimonas sp.]MCA2982158.1 response regulator transcription factor [Gemmatimonas sp.]MCA2986646.1 response regulator transcription factor [Gemmatimonas sp.]MCA2995244.1 response regulator transcription factor [Gemmatimonas sp.]MCE2952825.1 response regulator transcription factor [Gemmatimonas sp.]MCZ8012045.1 response regulator transcription factor [Gemmatimonas sp.]
MTTPTPARIRVLIADDHALVREGLRYVLDADPLIEVVAEASNGRVAVELALEHRPDVVVLDITMPEETGLKAAARVRELLPAAKVLLLSMHDQGEYVREGVRIGTHGYLLKDSAGEELRAAIRAVHAGGTFFSPAVVRRLAVAEAVPEHSPALQLELLTPRERAVLGGVARGLTNKAIAAELGISRRTVEAHRESLMRKLQIHSVAGLTRFALEAGIVEAG